LVLRRRNWQKAGENCAVRSCRVDIGQRGKCGYGDGTKGDEMSGAFGTELVGW